MCTCDMPRKPRLFRLDDRVLKGLDALAGDAKTNTNQFVESILFDFLKHAGKLSKEAEQLKDGRGGKRSGAGKPKRSLADEATTAGTGLKVETDVDAIEGEDALRLIEISDAQRLDRLSSKDNDVPKQ